MKTFRKKLSKLRDMLFMEKISTIEYAERLTLIIKQYNIEQRQSNLIIPLVVNQSEIKVEHLHYNPRKEV